MSASARRRCARAAGIGWALVIGSFPVWCFAFVAPFLPVSAGTRAATVVSAFVAGEAMFWIGAALLGPAVAARLRTPKVRTGTSYAGKTIAVVGATGGLGSAIVAALLREGAEVIGLGRDHARLAALAPHPRLATAALDLADAAAIAGAASACGALDAVVVAAGVDVRKPLLAHNDAEIDIQLAANLRGPVLLTRAFAPRMKPDGVIAHLGGFGDGRLALPYYTADVATRAGLAAFCQAANREFALEGIAVTVAYLCPAPAYTEAERPYGDLWRRLGTHLVSPDHVADFVLASILARRPAAVMGCTTWTISKLNGLWAAAADLAGLRRAGRALAQVFGSRARGAG